MQKKNHFKFNYLVYVFGYAPKDDVTKAVNREEDDDDVPKPDMVLDASLRCEAKEWQHRRTACHRVEEKR